MMNNNRMAMAMRQQMVQNPQMFAQNALNSGAFEKSKMQTRALHLVKDNDMNAAKEMVENQCRSHGVSIDDTVTQYKQYYGLN